MATSPPSQPHLLTVPSAHAHFRPAPTREYRQRSRSFDSSFLAQLHSFHEAQPMQYANGQNLLVGMQPPMNFPSATSPRTYTITPHAHQQQQQQFVNSLAPFQQHRSLLVRRVIELHQHRHRRPLDNLVANVSSARPTSRRAHHVI